MGNSYVWQGGQTENQGGQTKKFFRRFAPNFMNQKFAHPGVKPCRRPCMEVTDGESEGGTGLGETGGMYKVDGTKEGADSTGSQTA